jgi:tetratricopeptide (TPR) repeat protein
MQTEKELRMEKEGRHVFVSYVREDAAAARRLADSLRSFGFSLWLDEESLRAGERWKAEIRRAIVSGLGFIACFSTTSESRDRSYMREELWLAIEELRQRPHNQGWFIPVLLDEASVPDMVISPGETLNDLHHVRLHIDYQRGIADLARALWPEAEIVQRLLEESESLKSSGNVSGSIEKLTLGLQLTPRDPELLSCRARTFIEIDDYEAGLADLEEAGRDHWPELSWAYWNSGDLDSAGAILKRLRIIGKATAQTEYDLGCIMYSERRAKDAIACFERVGKFRPSSLAAHLAHARVAVKTIAHPETAQHAKQCQILFPGEPDFYEIEAISLVFQCKAFASWSVPEISPGEIAYIVELFERSLSLNDSNPKRYYRAAMCLYKLCAYADARSIGLRGLRIFPTSTSIRVVLAQVAEYGHVNKSEGIDISIKYYDEAAKYPLDNLELDDEFPILEQDTRKPRPEIPRYTTIPLMIAGVGVASEADYLKHYKDSTARAFRPEGQDPERA